VQFDIRFYVGALLFIIFDVEVAFFFPWANVFGKATHLMDPNLAIIQNGPNYGRIYETKLTPAAAGIYRELDVPLAAAPTSTEDVRGSAEQLAKIALIDILAFFAILMVGFAYVWRRGDLDWVRAVGQEPVTEPQRTVPSMAVEQEQILSA
jgi:NADH-quinone oxidoreductase subunit A